MTKSAHGEEVIAFAVGGTGGHVLPAINLARNLPGDGKRILMGVNIGKNAFVSHREFFCHDVDGANFSGGFFSGSMQIVKGIKQATSILRKEKVTHVVGMGGFHSLPVLTAAFFLQIPITLYEPNLIPGKVNKFFSFFSKRTLILFDEVKKHLYGKSQLIHLMTRKEQEEKEASKESLLQEFGLKEGVTTILVFGGSLGAASINGLIADALKHIKTKIQIIHSTGACKEVKGIYDSFGVDAYVTTFLKEMDKAWKACDFAVCRSGAGTIKESIIHNVPAVLIPYPHAVKNHQSINAKFMETVIGGAKTLEEKSLCEKMLAEQIDHFSKEDVLQAMRENIGKYHKSRKGDYIDGILL